MPKTVDILLLADGDYKEKFAEFSKTASCAIRLNEMKNLEIPEYTVESLSWATGSTITHRKVEESLVGELLGDGNTDFCSWAETDNSGICLLSGHCGESCHKAGCDYLSLGLGNVIFAMRPKLSSRRADFHDMRLTCIDDKHDSTTYSFSSPVRMVKKLLLQLAGIFIDKGRGDESIKVAIYNLENKSSGTNHYHVLLCTLEQVVKLFKEFYPDEYLNIFIERMSFRYPWPGELAVFLHVLTQLTRQHMPQKLKVLISGSGIFHINQTQRPKELRLWNYFNDMLGKEAEIFLERGFCSKPAMEQYSILYKNITSLRLDEKAQFSRITLRYTKEEVVQ